MTDSKKILYNREYRRTHKGDFKNWLTKTYGRVKRDSITKFNKLPEFSKEKLSEWVLKQGILKMLEDYSNSNFDKNKNPSIDRLDDYKGYSFDNIQLVTWEINNQRGRISEKNKKQCSDMAKKRWGKKVAQLDAEGNILAIYASTREAGRILNLDNSAISKVCRGVMNCCGGFGWRYE